MSDERARLFVALELPGDVREELERWRSVAVTPDGLRQVAEDSLHVTLCFLGSIASSKVDPIGAAMADALGAGGGDVPGLSLGAPRWLPRRRPNVLAVCVEDGLGALAMAQASISAALADGGWYRPESRPFLPHVTVARVRRGARVRSVELAPPAAVPFAGAGITLFRSRTDPRGAHYEPLRRA